METKKRTTIGIDKKLYEILDNNIKNKSKYIEWLIYQDMKNKNKKLDNIII